MSSSSVINLKARGSALVWSMAGATGSVAPLFLCVEAATIMMNNGRPAACAFWSVLAAMNALFASSFALRACADTDFAFERSSLIAAIMKGGLSGFVLLTLLLRSLSPAFVFPPHSDWELQLGAGSIVVVLLCTQRVILRALPPPSPLYLGHP